VGETHGSLKPRSGDIAAAPVLEGVPRFLRRYASMLERGAPYPWV
jgi:hypothetical protein